MIRPGQNSFLKREFMGSIGTVPGSELREIGALLTHLV
jgi:hypothetical protein